MNRVLGAWLTLVLLLASNLCNAAVFERDWKTPGDGLLTYDDVNQREWLDLSVSRLDQFSEPHLANAIAQIALGGLFEGFAFAKRDDVIALATSAGIVTTTSDISINESPTRGLIDLLSPTPPFTSTILHSLGFIDEVEPPPFRPDHVGADFFVDPLGLTGTAGLYLAAENDLFARGTVGLMLFRMVPEPSSLTQLSVIYSVVWLVFFRRYFRVTPE